MAYERGGRGAQNLQERFERALGRPGVVTEGGDRALVLVMPDDIFPYNLAIVHLQEQTSGEQVRPEAYYAGVISVGQMPGFVMRVTHGQPAIVFGRHLILDPEYRSQPSSSAKDTTFAADFVMLVTSPEILNSGVPDTEFARKVLRPVSLPID